MLGSKKSTKKRSKNGGGEPNGEGACGEQGVSLRETGGFITSFYWFHYEFLEDRLVAIWRYSSTSDFSFLISQYHQMCLEARCTKGLALVILVVILVIFSAGF